MQPKLLRQLSRGHCI